MANFINHGGTYDRESNWQSEEVRDYERHVSEGRADK
jgi:hypothetical protein